MDGVVGAHLSVILVEIIREGARHGGHREPEREFGGGAAVGAEQHGGHDGGPRARHARDHGQALRDPDDEIHRQRERGGVVMPRLEVELIDPDQDRAARRSAQSRRSRH